MKRLSAAPPSRKSQMIAAGVVTLLALALPFFVSDYRLLQLSLVITYAIALLGLVLLTGVNGQISLGHGAIFALGAYTTAILINSAKLPYWAAPPVSAAVCFVFGVLFGRPALRLPGHLLALATFGLAMAAPQLLRYKGVERWTGGVQGIMLDKPDAPFGLPISADQWVYLFVLLILVLAFVSLANLLDGRMGRAILAVRDNPIAASAMGIDLAFVKTTTFGYSALYTGVAGSASAIVVSYVAPDSFGVFLSITLLVGAVIGGLNLPSGALLGAFVIQFLPNITESISKSAPSAIYGLLLILAVYAVPGGLAGLVQRLLSVLSARRRSSARAASAAAQADRSVLASASAAKALRP
jgi:branched-chain amino acid transport system permease protein